MQVSRRPDRGAWRNRKTAIFSKSPPPLTPYPGLHPTQETYMATIRKEILINAPADKVWDVIRDIGAVHTRFAPGFVVDTRLEEGGAARIVTFANGIIAR